MGIHLNDIGTAFRATAKKYSDSTALDVSDATSIIFRFVKPQGDTVEKNAILVTDGVDGKVQYLTVENDLDEIGRWSVQLIIEFSNAKWHSDIYTFFVNRNLPAE